MNLKTTVHSLVLALGLLGCVAAPPSNGAGPGAATTTEWKEGYGGDSIAIEVRSMIETTCFQARKLRPYLIRRALETEKDVADAICNLLNTGELIIESVDQPTVGGIGKEAANYPDARPRRMQVKKEWWSSPSTTHEAKEKVILHELTPLIGLGDKDYVRSSRLQIALASFRGSTQSETVCDRSRLLSQYAGAPAKLGHWLSRELGIIKCRTAMDILVDTATNDTFEGATQIDFAHAYIIGVVTGVTRTHDPRSIKEFETVFMEALVRLPDSLAFFSTPICEMISGEEDYGGITCGNVVEFLFGARMHQKMLIAGDGDVRPFDFVRASYGLILRISESSERSLADALIERGNVDPVLVEAAVRSHSWAHLAFLGKLQRSLHPEHKPSHRLISRVNWKKAITESQLDKQIDYRDSGKALCVPDGFMKQAIAVLDGEGFTERCDDSFII